MGVVPLAWEEQGEGDVVLFVHGFPFDARMWQAQLAALPSGWRGVAPHLRGFGVSPAPAAEAYTMDDHAADVLGLLDRLDVRRAVVCGLSMGGYIALSLARQAPQRVRALVLADTRAEPDSAEAKQNRARQAEQVRASGLGPFVDAMLPKLLAPGAPPAARMLVERMMRDTSPETVVRALAGLAERPDARPQLAGLALPVLVIGGREDVITPPDVLAALAAAIPGARLRLLEGAGHVSNLEDAAGFNEALAEFLGALPA